MGLYVSTTGTDVAIPELGFTLVHPSVDYALSDQFTHDELQNAYTLTTNIRNGTLTWKKTSGGSTEIATDYDPDYLETEELNLGDGYQGDRLVSFKDLTGGGGSVIKSGVVPFSSFTGTPERKATVTFSAAFPDANYAVVVGGEDGRFWVIESKTASGFVINSDAVQPLVGNTYWIAVYYGGS